jgi:hypothetical protein
VVVARPGHFVKKAAYPASAIAAGRAVVLSAIVFTTPSARSGSRMEIGARPPDDAGQCGRSRGVETVAIRSTPTRPKWLHELAPDTPVLDWRERVVCSKCGGREVDFVVTGTKR